MDVKMEDANASEADYGSTADTMEQASDVESEIGSESSKKRRVASGLQGVLSEEPGICREVLVRSDR